MVNISILYGDKSVQEIPGFGEGLIYRYMEITAYRKCQGLG